MVREGHGAQRLLSDEHLLPQQPLAVGRLPRSGHHVRPVILGVDPHLRAPGFGQGNSEPAVAAAQHRADASRCAALFHQVIGQGLNSVVSGGRWG